MSVYADAAYSDGDGNLYTWGAGYDASYCLSCYHGYQFDLSITRVGTGETVAHIVNPDGAGETYAPAFAGELYEYGDQFSVWCSCVGDWVGTVTYSSVIVIPGAPPQSSASGTVFIDPNQNGWLDSGETPLAGTTVYLTDSADTYVIGTATTDASGGYAFAGLVGGSYRVKHPVPSGYVRTTDDSVAFSVPPDFGHNFGIAPLPPTTVELYATNYTPPLNSGPVQVWAEFSPPVGPEVAINWEGCTPDQMYNTVCWVETTTPGNRTVAVSATVSGWTVTDSLIIAVQQPPQLRLFLDVAPYDFSQSNPQSEDGIYVPGASEDGSSVPVGDIQAGQQVRVYAAFVDQANPNQIVAPPPNVSVTFTLDSISSWAGYAMNQGTGTDPDFAFQGSAQNIGFTGDLAQVILLCKDYGGSVTVGASASNGTSAEPLRLPRDTNANWLPDDGWKAKTGTGVEVVPDNVADPWSDSDGDIGPVGSPVPPADVPLTHGWYGDGLIRFHEYRGFVVQGTHIRTDPRRLDIFVSHNVRDLSQMLVPNTLAFAKSSLNQFRITLHKLYDQTQTEFTAEYTPGPGGPLNINVGYGGPVIPGYSAAESYQRALRIVNGTPSGLYGLTTGSCLPGGEPAQSGHVPLNVSSMEVNVQLLFTDGFQQPAFTTEMVLNEVRKTVAHETGHGVHISHRPQNSGQQCPDSATLGSTVSVMNNGGPLNGQDGSYPGSQYNATDIQQIRLHLRPNP